jgi:hypothetical protein
VGASGRLDIPGGPVGTVTGTFAAASRLVALAKSRESVDRRRNPFTPFVHLLVNMFLCAFSQRYLADDPDGVFLPLFIAAQCLLSLLITLSFVGRTGAEIVRKTRLLPGSAAARQYFLLAASLRRPEFLLFSAVGCLFPAFVFGTGAVAAAGIVAAALLPLVTTQVVCCAIAARLVGSDRPVTGLVVLTVAAAAAVVASVFVFRTNALAAAIPLAGWAASAITSFAAGRPDDALTDLLLLAIAAGAAVAVFRK